MDELKAGDRVFLAYTGEKFDTNKDGTPKKGTIKEVNGDLLYIRRDKPGVGPYYSWLHQSQIEEV